VNALRTIDRKDTPAFKAIVARARAWHCVVSRDIHTGRLSADLEKSRSQRFLSTIGADVSGTHQVLGLQLQLVDSDDGVLAVTAASILEGLPLAGAALVFEAAAVARSVDIRHQGWDNLKWLCLLNENDPEQTAAAIRA
jgi:hypothetical protein